MGIWIKAKKNQHLTNLAIRYLLPAMGLGLLLLFNLLMYPPALLNHMNAVAAFLLTLLTAIGLFARWVVARIFAFVIFVAVIFGSIWAIGDAFARLPNPSIHAFLEIWDTPILLLITLPAIGVGVYGEWAVLTQWSAK